MCKAFRVFCAVMALVAGASFGSAANAAQFDFLVTISNSNAPGFTPTTFVETLNLTVLSATTEIYEGRPLTRTGGSLTFSPTPFTADLQSNIDPINGGGGFYAEIFTDGIAGGQIRLEGSSTTLNFHETDGLYHYDNYGINFVVPTPSFLGSGPIGTDEIRSILASDGSLRFGEYAKDVTSRDQFGFEYVGNPYNRVYVGTAVLLPNNVPEPGSFVLLALGLALFVLIAQRQSAHRK